MDASEVVTLERFAHGGEAVGHLADGRVVFVAHALPGETVCVQVTTQRKRWARARLLEVLQASPDRVEPPCPYFGPSQCGGCTMQHIAPPRQRQLLRQVVVDQLERLGGIPDPPVAQTLAAGELGYRNRARLGVDADGALGYRRHASHDILPIDRCLLLDEPTQQLRDRLGEGWSDIEELEVRTATEGAAAVADPLTRPRLIEGDEALSERVGPFTFRVSATAFFQSNREGAATLLQLVRQAAALGPGETALDLYSGVGLFARGVLADGAGVTAVESHAVSAADARANLGDAAEVLQAPVAGTVARLHREGRRFTAVILDPPRRGAGRDVIQDVAALATRVIVLVACDPAALGRDAGHLGELGWRLAGAVPVDQFAQTGHIEVIATFFREDRG